MNHEQLQELIYDIVSKFFPRTVWARQVTPQLKAPFTSIKLGSSSRQVFGCLKDDAGEFRTDSATLEVNLCSNGRKIDVPGSTIGNYVNTVVSDMSDFVDYIESDEVQNILGKHGVSIMMSSDRVQDLSELQNDTQYEFRSYVEFNVTYYRERDGAYGILNMPDIINPSGGGSEELRTEIIPVESVEIEESENKEVIADEE